MSRAERLARRVRASLRDQLWNMEEPAVEPILERYAVTLGGWEHGPRAVSWANTEISVAAWARVIRGT